MRDLMIITPASPSNTPWRMDIDIIDGMPRLLPYARNTQDQRAAISAYTFQGTIPGKPNVGVNWAGLYNGQDETLVNIDNEVKQNIQDNAAIPNGPNGMYIPTYEAKDGSITVTIYQG